MLLALHRPRAQGSIPAFAWTTRVLSSVLSAPVRFYRNRQLLNAMAQMSAYELRDIGLTPQDVSAATALPFGQDPSALFVARASERRHTTTL